jgi:ParB-like nuclease domain
MIAEPLRGLARPVGSLRTLPGNPRRGDVQAVKRSLERFGQRKPIVARDDGTVIAGNHTLLAARELGWPEIAVVGTNDDDATAKAYALADNRTSELGTFDMEDLAAMTAEIQAADPALLTAASFTDTDLTALLDGTGNGGPPGEGTPAGGEEQEAAGSGFAIFPAEQIGQAAFEHYRRAGFPYRALPPHECMQAINRLARTPDENLLGTNTGYHAADTFHPRRFSVECTDSSGGRFKTPLEAFADDSLLRKAIRLDLDEGGGTLTGATLVAKLSLVSGTRAAANFRPGFALSMYRRFCPPGGTVLDCSAGFGGRLVGFLASAGGLYIGIEPLTCDGNQAMADALGAASRVELHALPAEDARHDLVAGRCDFAFTSPPYFGKERYADEPTQSWRRYQTGAAWRAGFLEPVMRLQFAALKPGAVAAVNIADVTMDGQAVPLEKWTVEAGVAAGFRYLSREAFPLGPMMGQGTPLDGSRSEAVFLFRKDP